MSTRLLCACLVALAACNQRPHAPGGVDHLAPSDPNARLQPPAFGPQKETLPAPELEWLVEGLPSAGHLLGRADLLQAFDKSWRVAQDTVSLYGVRDGAVVVVADDNAASYEKAIVALRLVTASGDDDLRVVSAANLASFRDEAAARLRRAGATQVLTPRSPTDGAVAAQRVTALFTANAVEVQLQLIAPERQLFDGRALLDVLASLGLAPDAQGRVEFGGFEVHTHTPPGRLDPTALLEGKWRPRDLVFELYVPNAPRAVESFELMVKAQAYAAQRLGGRTAVQLETFGRAQPSDLARARTRVAAVVAALDAAGFPPGAATTKRLFHIP